MAAEFGTSGFRFVVDCIPSRYQRHPYRRFSRRVTINIGSSRSAANIWVFAMKELFQPKLERILKEGGAK